MSTGPGAPAAPWGPQEAPPCALRSSHEKRPWLGFALKLTRVTPVWHPCGTCVVPVWHLRGTLPGCLCPLGSREALLPEA